MLKHFFKYFLLAWAFYGCAVTPVPAPQSKIDRLASLLSTLDWQIPMHESRQLSKDIFHKTYLLTKEFDLTSPPLWHNTLVNLGLRKKGLCYQWADALYTYLEPKHYKDFEFHLAGASIGEYFFEHNALVVTTKGGKVQDGIVIDPWRNSGKLHFSKVNEDREYHWVHRHDRGCQ